MNKIGFQNFRRFLNFEPIEYSGITFLVGRNNAGKSTLVKALLLIDNYLKSGDVSTLSFGNSVLEDANIVTYGRAKNKNATDNFIQFDYQFDNYKLNIVISGENDKTFAQVHKFDILNIENGISYLFEPLSSAITISRRLPEINKEEQQKTLKALEEELEKFHIEVDLRKIKDSSKDYINLLSELNAIKKKRQLLIKEREKDNTKPGYSIHTFYSDQMTSAQSIDFAISEALYLHDEDFKKSQSGKRPSKAFADYRGFKEDSNLIHETSKNFFQGIGKEKLVYLCANPAKQSALFAIRDTNNALAQSIHQFHELKISSGEPAYMFVTKWMVQFEVGEGFAITPIAGEAYEVTIQSHGISIPLADKGMGSIQAMLLILRLATIIHKATVVENLMPTVIIEEPELNLHPALQSKLADLFLDCYEQFKMKFIIETHSEYIVRRSQVLVVENEFEVQPNENPFCAHYFPKDLEDKPYRLRYNQNGVFDKNFGSGFFDEASSSTLTLLKYQRQKK